jgi:hypothetical protein
VFLKTPRATDERVASHMMCNPGMGVMEVLIHPFSASVLVGSER